MFWVLGALCVFFGAVVATAMQGDAVIFAGVLSFLLILVGGMFWISIMHMEEEK